MGAGGMDGLRGGKGFKSCAISLRCSGAETRISIGHAPAAVPMEKATLDMVCK